jgi:hypothetical protein
MGDGTSSSTSTLKAYSNTIASDGELLGLYAYNKRSNSNVLSGSVSIKHDGAGNDDRGNFVVSLYNGSSFVEAMRISSTSAVTLGAISCNGVLASGAGQFGSLISDTTLTVGTNLTVNTTGFTFTASTHAATIGGTLAIDAGALSTAPFLMTGVNATSINLANNNTHATGLASLVTTGNAGGANQIQMAMTADPSTTRGVIGTSDNFIRILQNASHIEIHCNSTKVGVFTTAGFQITSANFISANGNGGYTGILGGVNFENGLAIS